MRIERRTFLAGAAATVAVGLPVSAFFMRRPPARSDSLPPDPDGILDVLPGLSYSILERHGDAMSDGYRVPGAPDGMACFRAADGALILMRNHEVDIGDSARGAFRPGQAPPPEAYDPRAFGGVSRVVLDPETFSRASSNLVLAGTARNCAGGTSPWGWLTCEESVEPDHGFVFVCPIDAARVAAPVRVPAYGRFRHEAAAVDPATLVAYLTEDEAEGCFYRFVPDRKEAPFEGRLEALAIAGAPNFDTSSAVQVGERREVAWVPVADPQPRDGTVRAQARALGAARVRRGEGLWVHEGDAYFVSTDGGPAGAGQVFRYSARSSTLELVAQASDRAKLENPDNLTVAPWGGLFVVEDGPDGNFVRALGPDGQVVDVARNAKSRGELTGVCFDPSGEAMFLNLQQDGLTLVVRGPFRELGRVRA